VDDKALARIEGKLDQVICALVDLLTAMQARDVEGDETSDLVSGLLDPAPPTL
jgi:hypothetical protein